MEELKFDIIIVLREEGKLDNSGGLSTVYSVEGVDDLHNFLFNLTGRMNDNLSIQVRCNGVTYYFSNSLGSNSVDDEDSTVENVQSQLWFNNEKYLGMYNKTSALRLIDRLLEYVNNDISNLNEQLSRLNNKRNRLLLNRKSWEVKG